MKKITLLLLFCGLLAAHADFVYQSGRSFMTLADMDGDGRSDLVLVDGSNATVRVGYQLSAGNITWSEPRALGMAEVSDIACGHVLNVGHDVLVATEPMLNRYNIYELAAASQPPIPTAVYTQGAGSKWVTALDIGGTGNTAEDDLFTFSTMNGFIPNWAFWLRSDGSTLSALGDSSEGSEWRRPNEVECASGYRVLGCLDGAGNFVLSELSGSSISNIASVATGVSGSSDYLSFIPPGDTYAQFLVWEPGQYNLTAFATEEPVPGSLSFTTPVVFDMGLPITSVQLIDVAGTPKLAVIFKNGQSAKLYDYNGTAAPSLLQAMDPPVNELFVGFLPVESSSMVALSSASGDFSGAVTADAQRFSVGQFSSTGLQILPAIGNNLGRANVMTFASEPFVDNTPQRLQLLRAGDWSSQSAISGGTLSSTVETDAGTVTGLGNPHNVSLGAASPTAAYTLDNQLHAAISTYSFDRARGDELANIIINPSPGTYGTSIAVSFSVTPVASSIFYRTDPSDSWISYSAPIPLFKDTTVQYLAYVAPNLSITREATYTFSESPSVLDSDGDSVPDYVEIANGLDPLESGLDADGDGYSDLDELLAGTDPTDGSDYPASRLEQGSVYDQRVVLRPYDGVADEYAYSYSGTQVRLYSPAGLMHGYAKVVGSYRATISAVPLSLDPPFATIVTDTRFDLNNWAVRGTNNQRGVELVGVVLQPTSTVEQVSYEYQDGPLAQEASNWVSAAQATYSTQTRVVDTEYLYHTDVVDGLLIERKLADLLLARGAITNDWVSLFKGRVADQQMDGFSPGDLRALEAIGSGGESAYHLRTLIAQIKSHSTGNLDYLARDIYDICSDLGRNTNNAGMYPLPVDVLRRFIYDGTLQSNYLAATTRSAAQIAAASNEVVQALASVSARTWGSFTLTVQTNSFDAACPVLYTGANVAKSLYDANGNPFRFPTSFTLQPGATVSLDAFTDPDWDLCPGTDPLEVISLALTAVPTASGNDADGNLLPDDYEEMFLVGSGGLATSDLDGDGFSDLQEYLDGTDPNNSSSFGTTPVDFSSPFIWLDASDLSIGWPAAYASNFVFTVEYTEDLPGTPFATEQELPEGALGTVLDQSADHRFYRVKMRLR